MKRFITFLLIITVFSCGKDSSEKSELIQLIPPEAAIIIKFEDFSDWQKKIKNQSFLNQNQDNQILKFWSLESWYDTFEIPNELILSYNNLGKNNLVGTIIFENTNDFKTKIKSKKSYQYDQVSIQVYENENDIFYLANLAENNIISTSKIILENIIRNHKSEIKAPQRINKLLDILSDNTPSMIVNTELFSDVSTIFFNNKFPKNILSLSDYIGFDLNFNEEVLLFSGIIFQHQNDDTVNWLNFNKVNAEKSLVAEVIPSNFIKATSILISDYKTFMTNENTVETVSKNDSILINIKELSAFSMPVGSAYAIVSKNIDQTFSALEKQALPLKSFGATQIYELNQPRTVGSDFKTLIRPKNLKYFVVLQDIIVGSDRIDVIEDIIIQVNNQNVLSLQENYTNHLESITGQSHVLWLSNLNQQSNFIDTNLNPDFTNDYKNIDWSNHELLISQLIVEDDFAYLNILQKKTKENKDQSTVEQIVRLKAETEMLTEPQFFKNWRTGQQDIVYQDINNVLHLKDTKGNLIWSKQLDSPIVGEISSIDIYQNTRIQLAFATQNKVYILDKNGNDVSVFPLEFKNTITQSLSVFDYDNNGRYRFIVVMDRIIRMYDKEGKRVRGFKFKKTKTPLAYPMKHIRIGRKDYIFAQEESGQLHILNRTGKNRINIDEDFQHSDNEWYENKKKFISATDDGKIISINEKGKISYKDKKWINPKFSANPNIIVSMSENQLYIDESITELPYGVYTIPKIIGNHIGIADTQTQKIYIINTNGDVLDGFPVYGKKITDAYTNDNGIVLLCQDENNAALVYKVKFNR